jgi:putative tricarboxylic transport membrane protein
MARNGRAGPALGIATFSSFIAGTLGVITLMLLAIPLATVALRFGPPEYVALMVLGLTIVTYLAHGSMLKAIIMALIGVVLGNIGTDMITGQTRFTFGIMELEDGVRLVPLVMGLFGIGEVLISMEESVEEVDVLRTKIKGLLPNWKDWKDSIEAILRGTFLGFFLGILPGGGAVLASFLAYGVEKKVSKHPEKFGTGVIEGVAAPEAANNSATAGAFIPLFALGIPSNAVTALLLGALMIHGLRPGPMLLRQHPEIFWGTVVSMYIGNLMLLVLNLPLIGLWVKVLKIPPRILFPFIFFFCIVGSYSENSSIFDVSLMLVFGLVGYFIKKFKYEPAPMVLALILTPMLENALRQSLIMSEGSFLIFFSRPVAAIALIIALILLFTSVLPHLKKRREMVEN